MLLLKVQVYLRREYLCYFAGSVSMCNCCIVLFYLTRQSLKGSKL